MESIVVNRGQTKTDDGAQPRQTAVVRYRPSAKRLAQQDMPVIPRPAKYRKKPWLLEAARRDRPDDLTRIFGLSLADEAALNALGIFHFDQMAIWDDANVAWLQENWPAGCQVQPAELIAAARKLI